MYVRLGDSIILYSKRVKEVGTELWLRKTASKTGWTLLPGNYTLHKHQRLGSLTQQEAELRQTVHKQLIQPSNCQSLNEEQLNKYLGDKKTLVTGKKKSEFPQTASEGYIPYSWVSRTYLFRLWFCTAKYNGILTTSHNTTGYCKRNNKVELLLRDAFQDDLSDKLSKRGSQWH